ncbi:MAG: type VI secretion system contractile sheath small subunit [Desulfobacterales bacterium]|nr:type VI secretion system contractile sheath small subunit [Desulfobacterales bacterium]
MAKEASVAPRERVNIVYRPAIGDAKEEVELPLRLLIMSDFTGKPDDRAVEDREPISVDKDNFNEILKGQNINMDITVPNRLSGEAEDEMAVSLKFDSLKDFEPEAIAKNTPELNRLLKLREALTALKGPLSNLPEFRKKVQELVKDDAVREQLLKELGIED